ncbi:YicC/YloC family endoribonuclease [Tepidibacillus sp. LV47]|uniref:YicC/YloC family endoribonuclease n=1 Tax=Tepidibacillus sp. LV47 TaxID=3398228 RepID=UPI003AAB2DC8
MIKSMTGFSRKEAIIGNKKITIEMKTVNHRFLEVVFKMPKELMVFEDRLKKILQHYIKRGRIDIIITIEANHLSQRLNIDWDLADQYIQLLKELKERFQLAGNVEIKDFLLIPDLISQDVEINDLEDKEEEFFELFAETCRALFDMRQLEGTVLSNDFLSRLNHIEKVLQKVEIKAPLVVKEYREKLLIRVNEWLNGVVEIDEARLLNEVAFFADKANIDEEITRLKSHIEQFRLNLTIEEPVGRKLDFLVQEMNREVNTIGSKANDLELSQYVIELKSELEKIREQVQNVE